MQSINALSLGPDAREWLENSRHPRILHIFDSACNLINERREILSVVTPQIGNGPFNLVVEDDILFSNHLHAESPIFIRTDQLNLGDLTVSIAAAKLWNPRPDWEQLHAKRDDILNQLISLPITYYQPLLPNSLVSNLSSALVIIDISSALKITSQMAGLGQGLTPAGDDFMMGSIYAVWIIHPLEVATVLAKEITRVAAPLTTSLSAAWLKSAGKGEAGVLWHDFFDSLVACNTADVELQITKLLSVGETSGADAMAGFISVFTYWGQRCSKLWGYNQTQ